MDKLIYQTVPIVTFATNKFINVPIITGFEELGTPLVLESPLPADMQLALDMLRATQSQST